MCSKPHWRIFDHTCNRIFFMPVRGAKVVLMTFEEIFLRALGNNLHIYILAHFDVIEINKLEYLAHKYILTINKNAKVLFSIIFN